MYVAHGEALSISIKTGELSGFIFQVFMSCIHVGSVGTHGLIRMGAAIASD